MHGAVAGQRLELFQQLGMLISSMIRTSVSRQRFRVPAGMLPRIVSQCSLLGEPAPGSTSTSTKSKHTKRTYSGIRQGPIDR